MKTYGRTFVGVLLLATFISLVATPGTASAEMIHVKYYTPDAAAGKLPAPIMKFLSDLKLKMSNFLDRPGLVNQPVVPDSYGHANQPIVPDTYGHANQPMPAK